MSASALQGACRPSLAQALANTLRSEGRGRSILPIPCRYRGHYCEVVWRSPEEASPAASIPSREENLVSIAIVSLLVLVVVVIIAIPIMIRVFGEPPAATRTKMRTRPQNEIPISTQDREENREASDYR